MNQQSHFFRRKSGFVGVVFLGIALIAIVVGTMAIMNRSNKDSSDREKARMLASTLISHMADFQSGYDRMTAEGIDPLAITLDTNASTGMFNPEPSSRFSTAHKMPAASISTASANADNYIYTATKYRLPAGSNNTTGIQDHVVVAGSGVTLDICRSINNILHGDLLTLSPPLVSGNGNTFLVGATAVNITVVDPDVNRLMRLEGCIVSQLPPIRYMHYRILKAT